MSRCCLTLHVVVVLLCLAFSPTARAQSLNEVLDGVSRNVKQFQDLLPDFVCNERVTSTQFESGRVIKQKVVESLFTGVQQASEKNRFRLSFTESREVIAIDGKAARKGTPFPKLPYSFAGGYSSLLITTFAPDNLELHDYNIADRYRSANGTSILIRFATKPGQQKLRAVLQGTPLISKDVGAAWVDEKTFQVIRLQRQSLNLPPDLTRSNATADYGPVTIEDRTFWMPTTIRAEVTEKNTQLSVSYVAEYSDCKRFTADIKILQ